MSFPLPRLTRWTWSSDTTTDLEACRDPAEDLDDGPFQPTVLRTTIENHRAGYPQYSALLSCADNFLVFRRFKRMRSRILLLKQDKLTALEKRLDEIDKAEENPLFLGVSRVDGNKERQDTLFKIEEGLADFDRFTEMMELSYRRADADIRDVASLQNWLDRSGSVTRKEVEYLHHDRDLCRLLPSSGDSLNQFEDWVERKMSRIRSFRQWKLHNVSSNPKVIIYSGTFVKRVAHILFIILVTLLLLLPIVICNKVADPAARLVVVLTATVIYLVVLSLLTRVRTVELVVAATTYATVLIVFVSGAGS